MAIAWWPEVGQMSTAAALAVFGIVLLVTAGKTRLTYLLTASALAASAAMWIHFFHFSIPGWPAFLVGVFVWINAYATFKHRMALSASIQRSYEARTHGRRHDD